MSIEDKPCSCGRAQAMAELAAELVKLKQDHGETETVALVTNEICMVLVERAGIGMDELKRLLRGYRRRRAEELEAEPKEGENVDG